MKVIYPPGFRQAAKLPRPLGNILRTLQYGHTYVQEMQAQEEVVASLGKTLDNRFVLFREVTLDNDEFRVPLLLIGPAGIWVLVAEGVRGLFRVEGDVWEKLNERTQGYQAVRPNPVNRGLLLARAIDAQLKRRGIPAQPVELALLLTNPGAHVETVRPAVRIVLVDGINRFGAGLMQSRILNRDQIQSMVNAFRSPQELAKESQVEMLAQDYFTLSEEAPPALPHQERLALGEIIGKALGRAPLSSRRMLFLGCLVLVNIFIVVIFVMIILVTN